MAEIAQDPCSTSGLCNEIDELYELQEVIGKGAYGVVSRGRDRRTGRAVAVKRSSYQQEDLGQGVPTDVLRETSSLMDLTHPNVVKLFQVLVDEEGFSLIFEFLENDLHKVMKANKESNDVMPLETVKKYSRDLIRGLHACHLRLLIHRDLKPQNLLIGEDGLKVADFGLARAITMPRSNYTNDVVTLWYRAPEILLGANKYGPEIDIWSAGCIIAEMAIGHPIFPGDCEIGMIFRIFKLAGTPTADSWPSVADLPNWKPTFPKFPPTGLQGFIAARPEISSGMGLLRSMLAVNPQTRISARQAQLSPFLCNLEV